MSVDDRADMIEAYRRALTTRPKWAVAKAFDEWERTGSRRPSPAELNILAGRAMKVITDELARRKKEATPPEVMPKRTDDDRAAGLIALEKAGFTPKRLDMVRRRRMARSEAELYAPSPSERQPHWTETVDQDSAEMKALRKARAGNALMQGKGNENE